MPRILAGQNLQTSSIVAAVSLPAAQASKHPMSSSQGGSLGLQLQPFCVADARLCNGPSRTRAKTHARLVLGSLRDRLLGPFQDLVGRADSRL